jgi:Fic family protein
VLSESKNVDMTDEPEEWKWEPLPPDVKLETPEVLKKALEAQRYLSELKGISQTMPNQVILLNTLPLQEARDSSEIENIVTTSDALYKAGVESEKKIDQATKEVRRYSEALIKGYNLVLMDGLLTTRHILSIQQVLEDNEAGIRKLPGTKLSNPATGEIVFVPPQNIDDIDAALKNLEEYINDDSLSSVHPLIKMAVIHVQFESIHPFYDGNGRTGRIINMLYLVQKELLDLPVLYLSRFIVQNKPEYYRLLQRVSTHNDWHSWVLYMLEGVANTSRQTITVITGIRDLMMDYKHRIRKEFPFYSQDLINHLFKHPYSKINYLKKDLKVSRQTAAKYLDELAEAGLLEKVKQGRDNYYINHALLELLIGNRK